LEKVNSGEVPPGSILVVENIDRLGREAIIDALETIVFGLLKYEITIETLFPRDTYTKDSINNGGIWKLIAHVERAHAESKRKSDLSQANWKHKRKIASKDQMLTSLLPAWFKVTPTKVNDRVVGREVSVIPEAKGTIVRIFKMKLDGLGRRAIVKRLNQSASWTPKGPQRKSSGWPAPYVQKILSNRAVLGEFQPHRMQDGRRVPEGEPIAKYYEAIVPPALFYAVQKQLAQNRGKGGGSKTGAMANVFRHLARCGYCGGAMLYINKGKGKRGARYLMCDNARRGVMDANKEPVCHINAQPYPEFEETVLDNCAKLKPELVLPTTNEQAAEKARLRTKIEGLQAESDNLEKQSANFIDQIGTTSNAKLRAVYEQRVEAIESKKAGVEAERAKAETLMRELQRGAESFTQWQRDLIGLKDAMKKDDATRIRLNVHLREFIERVEIFSKGHEDTIDHVEELVEQYKIADAKAYKSFRKYIRQRLLSKEGRLFRIHYKGARGPLLKTDEDKDAGIQVAPASSLAQRTEVQGKERKYKMPAIDVLFKDFFDHRTPGFTPKQSALKLSAK
jgi:DNA invertase Pin-like site-specific DNA recombinase